jgi:glutathione S-transferase
MSIILHGFPLSGHTHRVELFLSLLGLSFTRVNVDLPQGAHKKPEYLVKNPLGEVPVLEDGEVTLADSNAILVYLALRYDPTGHWLPREPVALAQVQRWFSIAAGQLKQGPGTLRVAALFKRTIDRSGPVAISKQLLSLLEATLARQSWLVGSDATLADLSLYTYTAHAPEGGISLEPYPAVRSWLARVEALPGFVPMAKLSAS